VPRNLYLFFFFSARGETQGLTHARQALYHWAIFLVLISFLKILPGVSVHIKYICFLSLSIPWLNTMLMCYLAVLWMKSLMQYHWAEIGVLSELSLQALGRIPCLFQQI
jgi:hypothetical protein